MATMDMVFVKEFKQMLKDRASLNRGFSLSDIPFGLQGEFYDIAGFDGKKPIYKVSRIVDKDYESLNGTLVQAVSGSRFEVTLRDSQGTVVYDALGEPCFVVVEVPDECTVVQSKVQLPVSLQIERSVTSIETYFGLVGEEDGMYRYYIPKECLYVATPVSLCVSFKKPKDCYTCIKVTLTNGYEVFLSVVPLRVAASKGYRVLVTKLDTNFASEIKQLYGFWLRSGVIFDARLCTYATDFDTSSLSWVPMESNLESYEYKPVALQAGLKVDTPADDASSVGSPDGFDDSDDWDW